MKRLFVLPLVFFFTAASSWAQSPEEECVDTWPEDRERPKFEESFPLTGTSGHVAVLKIKATHLPGEQLFPAGLDLAADSAELGWLKNASFRVPDSASEVRASVNRGKAAEAGTTWVEFPLIPLPAEAGRIELTLPRLPVAVARASGQVHTICTQPHVITVEDPLSSANDPKAKPDPEPRVQIEVWTSLRDTVMSLLWAIPLALLLFWLFLKWKRREKKAPPPPPPIPPWDTALAQLRTLEERDLLSKHEYEEYLDRVSDVLRQYLGDRYGFDGLESTTRELIRQLASRAPHFAGEQVVSSILQRTDLVKFARGLPSEEECREAFKQTRELVRSTTAAPSLDPRLKNKENSIVTSGEEIRSEDAGTKKKETDS